MKNSGILDENFASMNIQEVSDDLNKDEAFIDDDDEAETLDEFSKSQLTQNNDTWCERSSPLFRWGECYK